MLNNVKTPDKSIIEGKGKIEDPILLNKGLPSSSEDKSIISSQPQKQLVRYKRGEKVKDLDGNTVDIPLMKLFGGGNIPMEAVEGEPANAEEYINDLAKLIWDNGKRGEDAYKFMRKKYRASSALIDKDDATFNDKTTPEDQKKYKYYFKHEWEGPDGKESYYISPLEAAEIKVAKDHGLNLEEEGSPLAQIREGPRPSTAARIINKNKKLKENWEKVLNNPRDLDAAAAVSESLRELKDYYRNYRLYGFDTRDEFNQYIDYIGKSLGTISNKLGAGEAEHDNKVEETTTTIAKPAAKKKATATTVATAPSPVVKDEGKKEDPLEKDETKDPLEKAEELEQPRAPADIKRFSNNLNRFVIQAYLNGDFGKKSSPNAIATMGFFILDKIGAALVNASEVARGMSPSAKSQWSDVLDKQTELLGKRITADWFLSLSKDQQEALVRSGVISGTTAQTIYETVDPNAVGRAEQKDILEISKLSQEQKGVAQSNINALLARKSELQTIITQLKSDQGWEVYTQAMNAIVGTAKGLNSLGVTDASSSSSQKGFSDTLSANVSTGSVTKAFVSGGVSNNSSWNNSSAKALSKSNSLNQDALALSKFKSGESYAKATREAKKEANEQLIKRLEGQIKIIDECINSWGKDLGL